MAPDPSQEAISQVTEFSGCDPDTARRYLKVGRSCKAGDALVIVQYKTAQLTDEATRSKTTML